MTFRSARRKHHDLTWPPPTLSLLRQPRLNLWSGIQEKSTEAQLQHQQAADMQAAAASASQVQVQQLTAEVQQLKAYYDNLHHQLQQAQQLKSASESQIEAWKAQHAQQAPQVAELLSERQAWIEELQTERAAASAAAAAAEVSDFPQTLCPVCYCNDLCARILSQRLAGLHDKLQFNAVPTTTSTAYHAIHLQLNPCIRKNWWYASLQLLHSARNLKLSAMHGVP